MSASLQHVNGVRSNLIEEQIQQQSLPPSADAIIIFGTASQGPLLTPTRVTSQNAERTFGATVADPYERFNLIKGFHEINESFPRADIIAVRVGDAKKASLTLYEHQVSSGTAPSGVIYNPQPEDTVSLQLEALTDGIDGNEARVEIYGNNGVPTRALVFLPNGSHIDFDMVNQYKTPSALSAALNADDEVSAYIKSTANVLGDSAEVTITENELVSGQIQNIYRLPVSYMLDITSAYIKGGVTDADSIGAGRSSATLANTPIKDEDEFTTTINKFWSIVQNETIQEKVTPLTEGETYLNLTAAAESENYDNTDLDDRLMNVVVTVKSGTTGIETVLEEDVDYEIEGAEPRIKLIGDYAGGVGLGDVWTATYWFLTSFGEANVRSILDIGNPYSYFVGGDTITFGASQTWPIAVRYETKNNFAVPGDVTINDAPIGEVKFAINASSPDIGDVVTIEYLFEPELPAPNSPQGALLPSGNRQGTQLSGGTDGRIIDDLAHYYQELAKGYLAADNTPFRIVCTQGVYVDDVMASIDFETGLPVQKPAGFHTQLSTFLARHSIFVSECVGIMSTQPMATANPGNPTLEERENWYNSIVNVSTLDTNRPANIVSGINDYHLVITTGDLLVQLPNVKNGRIYIEGAHNIYAGMKFFHDNLTSIVTRSMPRTIVRGMIYKVVATDRVNAINAMRYTLITEDSDTGDLKPASAPTMALPTSQFRKQYNLDIAIEAVNEVRRVLKPFVGQPNKNSVREAMRQTARQRLQLMSPDKLLQFDLEVLTNKADSIDGKVQVDMTLTTAVEIQTINIRTRLQLGF